MGNDMKDNQPKPNNAVAKPGAGTAVEPKKPGGLEALKNMDGSYVDMQDLVPVMSSFQDYLEEEKKKTASKLQTMGLLFLLLIVAFVGAVMFMSQLFVHQSQVHVEQYLATEQKSSKALLEGLETLTAASRELREELALQRSQRSAPAAAAATQEPAPAVEAPAVATTPVVETPAPAPAVVKEPAAPAATNPAPVVVETTASAGKTGEVAAVVSAPVEVKAPGENPKETTDPKKRNGRDEKPEVVQTDLESLLKQIEQAIAEKENELKGRRKN